MHNSFYNQSLVLTSIDVHAIVVYIVVILFNS